MSSVEVHFEGIDELKRAIARNPEKVATETKVFLQRGMAAYRKTIWSKPWKIGDMGGGVPVDTDHLRRSHAVRFDRFSASIGPARNYPVTYAPYVHFGTRKMIERPWLDYAKRTNEQVIRGLYHGLLANIARDLAR